MNVTDYYCERCGQLAYRMPAESPPIWSEGHPRCCGENNFRTETKAVEDPRPCRKIPPTGRMMVAEAWGDVPLPKPSGTIADNDPMFAKF